MPECLLVLDCSCCNPYGAEHAAAKKAITLAAHLCERVQQDLLKLDVQTKADRTPVTVADYDTC
ncbi:hypothetical protein E2562_000294 [Oryza meyeriana var. granulata]|uniref:Uncharacterized protein n=1 Tax=Oryza meyeriana var. granulata TaxID=110450 RepID=A0A6G1CP43_9ORYZ|nr:hypothetical protein E2562_000294 [Oryza meyeriana var. granulata]